MKLGIPLVVALSIASTACTAGRSDGASGGAVRRVGIDIGGTSGVVMLAPGAVEAAPGDVVRIEHGGMQTRGEAAVVHGLVAAPVDELPPLFVPAAGGAVPNGGVWGECRGGRPQDASFGCPVLPIDGPRTWDGRAYWATGAMTPGEHRDVPLSTRIHSGSYTFVCAFHPRIRVVVRVTEDPEPVPSLPVPNPGEAITSVPAAPGGAVLAGFETSDSSVNAFSPAVTHVKVGREVTWKVSGRDPHDVVFSAVQRDLLDSPPAQAAPSAPDGPWDGIGDVWSGFMSTDPSAPGGTSFSLGFGEPGRYRYFCTFHPDMRGVVVARARPSR